jgi:glutamate carboxypeptidase
MTDFLAWSRERVPDMVGLLRELVTIETPSHDVSGGTTIARRLGSALEELGYQPSLVPVPEAGPLLSLEQPGGVFLLGHMDTVWPLGTLARRPPRLEGDRFFAPGAFDMKAGLVVVLFALRALRERGLSPKVSVFFTPLEEVGGEAYRPRMEALMKASRAVLDFEPAWPGGAVKTARKGSLSMQLRVRGRASHAGADFEKGRSAVLEVARKVLQVSEFSDPRSGITVNVGVVRGGIRPNVVPDLAEAEIDCRYPKREQGVFLEQAFREMRPSLEGTTLEWETAARYPPLERTEGVASLYAEARAVAASMGLELEEAATGGASEASYGAALGVPTLDGLGADGDGAHAEEEHVLVSSLAGRVALAAGLLERLSASPPSAHP